MSALRHPRQRDPEGFLAHVTHELRSPMCAITGLAELLLERRHRLREQQTNEILSALVRQSEYMTRLIDGLIDLARIDAGLVSLLLEPVDVGELCQDIAAADPPPAGRTLSIRVDGDRQVLADRLRLEQVLRNLLRNAYAYGGDQVIIGGRRTPGRYEIAVTDDGPGVPEELIPNLFQPLVRGPARAGKVHGSGIGLSICRKLVEAAGGTIRYDPPGRGARFVINLARPARRRAEAQPAPTTSAAPVAT